MLGKVPGQPQFTQCRDNAENLVIPGLLIVRAEEGIFYVNAESIRDQIMALMWDSNTPVETAILDLEMTGDLDLAGAEMLEELHSELRGYRCASEARKTSATKRECCWLRRKPPGKSA